MPTARTGALCNCPISSLRVLRRDRVGARGLIRMAASSSPSGAAPSRQRLTIGPFRVELVGIDPNLARIVGRSSPRERPTIARSPGSCVHTAGREGQTASSSSRHLSSPQHRVHGSASAREVPSHGRTKASPLRARAERWTRARLFLILRERQSSATPSTRPRVAAAAVSRRSWSVSLCSRCLGCTVCHLTGLRLRPLSVEVG